MLLTGLSQIIRADAIRTMQLNREKWAEYVALMKSKLMYTKLWFKIVVEGRAMEEIQKIILKWIVKEFLISSFIHIPVPPSGTEGIRETLRFTSVS
jgi:hypothetical protein